MTSPQDKWRSKQIAQGKCSICNRPLTTKRLCEYHRLKAQSIIKEIRKRRREKGKCIQCGKDLTPTSKSYCSKHLVLNRERQQAYRRKKRGI